MAVRDGVVAWLGSDPVGRSQFPGAQIIDLDGAFVAPAFVDSHVHLTATGCAWPGWTSAPPKARSTAAIDRRPTWAPIPTSRCGDTAGMTPTGRAR